MPGMGLPFLSSFSLPLQFSSLSLPTNRNCLSSAFGINTQKARKALPQRKDCSNEDGWAAKPFPFTCNTSSARDPNNQTAEWLNVPCEGDGSLNLSVFLAGTVVWGWHTGPQAQVLLGSSVRSRNNWHLKGTGSPEEQSQANPAHYILRSKRSAHLDEEPAKKTPLLKKYKFVYMVSTECLTSMSLFTNSSFAPAC